MKTIAIVLMVALSMLAGCQTGTQEVKKETSAAIPAECTMWFDGCNNCMVSDGQIAGCTRKYCPDETMKEPKCLEVKKEALISRSESCQQAGGNWIEEHNECEYIGKDWCDAEGGNFNECGSACRNIESEICTMQCVPFCKF